MMSGDVRGVRRRSVGAMAVPRPQGVASPCHATRPWRGSTAEAISQSDDSTVAREGDGPAVAGEAWPSPLPGPDPEIANAIVKRSNSKLVFGACLLLLTALLAGCISDEDDAPTAATVPTEPVATAEAAQATSTAQPSATAEATATSAASSATPSEAAPTAPAASTATPAPTLTPIPSGPPPATARAEPEIQEYPVPAGSRPHDVAPAVDGGVWYTAQGSGELGWLDPATGETRHIALGDGSAPHGVIVGPDGAPWITDGGLNAIVRVDPVSDTVTVFPLPDDRPNANLNTAAFDGNGNLWFTGQNGIYGRLDTATGDMQVFDAPRGAGPYGITGTPDGGIYFSSLAGSYIAAVNIDTAELTVHDPPTAAAGARRVWSDSQGVLWVSEWFAGQLGRFDPSTGVWTEWRLPGDAPQTYAVYVDERDHVWTSDFGANALVRFDPATEQFTQFVLPSAPADVRQILGRPGEIWGAESGVDKLVVIRT